MSLIKEKQTKAGKLFEADFYPCWSDGRKMPTKPPKTKGSTEAQKKYNENKAQRTAIFTINENFDIHDYIGHLTYAPEYAPQSEEEARRDMVNAIRRIKRLRERELKKVLAALDALPDVEALAEQRKNLELKRDKLSAPFKYMYVIEKVTYRSGAYKGRDNWHFHIFMTGGLERSQIEALWKKGIRSNVDQFQPDRFGPEAMAKYMVKDPQGTKRFICSRNMSRSFKEPRVKNSRLSAAGVERIAKERVDDAAYWEKRYKGYRFLRAFPRFNEYNGHWYITVLMYAAGDGPVPKWDIDDWPNDDWDNKPE